MKTLESIIEDPSGNVIGAHTSEGPVILDADQRFPRAQLAARARHLAAVFGVTIPTAVEAKLPPSQTPGLWTRTPPTPLG